MPGRNTQWSHPRLLSFRGSMWRGHNGFTWSHWHESGQYIIFRILLFQVVGGKTNIVILAKQTNKPPIFLNKKLGMLYTEMCILPPHKMYITKMVMTWGCFTISLYQHLGFYCSPPLPSLVSTRQVHDTAPRIPGTRWHSSTESMDTKMTVFLELCNFVPWTIKNSNWNLNLVTSSFQSRWARWWISSGWNIPVCQTKQRCFSTSHRQIGVPSAVELLRLVYWKGDKRRLSNEFSAKQWNIQEVWNLYQGISKTMHLTSLNFV